MIELLWQIPQYKLFRALGHPRKLPLNITVSLTYRCNARCKTCNIWRRKAEDLSLEELDLTFKSLGEAPYWFTMGGGEPFLRKDLVEICQSAYKNCKPGLINIASNGLFYEAIPDRAREIVESCPRTNIVINLSLDGIGPKHDEMRGVPGNWDKTMQTYDALRKLRYPNFKLGVHSVISKYNLDAIPETCEYILRELKPDSYITEIAEERVELGTIGADFVPSLEEYSRVADFLCARLKQQKFSGISRITQSFRLQYYNLVKQTLREKKQVIPCYAGFASVHIVPAGDVWFCCTKAEPIGNLRDANYDFSRVWFSEKAEAQRKSIKEKECYCPLANVSYTNILCHLPSLARVVWRLLLLQNERR
jgi:MoaA/NifB/PqqE/SkfB family radical SAM enzyme